MILGAITAPFIGIVMLLGNYLFGTPLGLASWGVASMFGGIALLFYLARKNDSLDELIEAVG
jgi:hypothetical protein